MSARIGAKDLKLIRNETRRSLGSASATKKNFLEVHKSRIFSSGGKKARSTYFAICRYVTSFLLRNLTIHSGGEVRVVQTKYSGFVCLSCDMSFGIFCNWNFRIILGSGKQGITIFWIVSDYNWNEWSCEFINLGSRLLKLAFDNDVSLKRELGTIFLQVLLTRFLHQRFNWWVILQAFIRFGRKIEFVTNIIQFLGSRIYVIHVITGKKWLFINCANHA